MPHFEPQSCEPIRTLKFGILCCNRSPMQTPNGWGHRVGIGEPKIRTCPRARMLRTQPCIPQRKDPPPVLVVRLYRTVAHTQRCTQRCPLLCFSHFAFHVQVHVQVAVFSLTRFQPRPFPAAPKFSRAPLKWHAGRTCECSMAAGSQRKPQCVPRLGRRSS